MARSVRSRFPWPIATALVLALSGCGLKGPLTLPSKSEEVVIRGPGQASRSAQEDTAAPPSAAEATPAAAGEVTSPPVSAPESPPATAAPEAAPAPGKKPPSRRYDRPPPPPLPAGNPGTSRGG